MSGHIPPWKVLPGGANRPGNTRAEILVFICILGIFFVLPCIESYQKVDLRTITLGVPPQEVGGPYFIFGIYFVLCIYE